MLIENSLPKNIVINGNKIRNKIRIAFFNVSETVHIVITINKFYLELETISSKHKSEKIKTDLLNIIPLISSTLKKSFGLNSNINPAISSALRNLL